MNQPKYVRAPGRPAPVNAETARRRLAQRYIPDEPRRPRYADIENMIGALPYGIWTCADSRVVLFNRRYCPIWEKLLNGTVQRADATEWVPFVDQRWFDFTDARYERHARDRLRNILQDFFDGKDLTQQTIITEWDLDPPELRS